MPVNVATGSFPWTGSYALTVGECVLDESVTVCVRAGVFVARMCVRAVKHGKGFYFYGALCNVFIECDVVNCYTALVRFVIMQVITFIILRFLFETGNVLVKFNRSTLVINCLIEQDRDALFEIIHLTL